MTLPYSHTSTVPHPRPRVDTAERDPLDRRSGSSDDLTTPRAEWKTQLQSQRPEMDLLTPNTAPRRSGSSKGKGRAVVEEHERSDDGYGGYQEPEYLTVRPNPHRMRSGESQEAWFPERESRGPYERREGDLEMGREDGVGNRDGVGIMDLGNGSGAYPPVSEEEAEERRIQEHLAKIAARDMARRKAARASKQFLPVTGPTSNALSPVTSTLASGLSRASTLLRNRTRRGGSSGGSSATLPVGNDGTGKRPSSGFGFSRIGSVDSTLAGEREEERRRGWQEHGEDGETDIALSYQPPRSPASFARPPSSRPSSTNPYDQSLHAGHANTGYPIPSPATSSRTTRPSGNSPSRTTQPGIETEPVPLLRPQPSHYSQMTDAARASSKVNDEATEQGRHSRMESSSSGWKGPHWYGGASGGAYSDTQGTSVAAVRKDRWWHALCAWGDDLDDGGEDGQAGRTNPFE